MGGIQHDADICRIGRRNDALGFVKDLTKLRDVRTHDRQPYPKLRSAPTQLIQVIGHHRKVTLEGAVPGISAGMHQE